MPLSCVDISIGARIVSVLGLVTASVVVAQLAVDLSRGYGDGEVAVLLGMSLDEMDSRQRHGLHEHEHHGPHDPHPHLPGADAPKSPEPFDEYVHGVLSGFLTYGVLYWLASALLAYSSLVCLRWGALPWIVLHTISIASQVARLVVQVAQYQHYASEPDHHALFSHPMSPHAAFPGHEAWDAHVLEHEREHEVQMEHSAVVNIAVTVAYLLACVYMWLVVLVAHKQWSVAKPRRRCRGLGDEGFSLSLTNISPKEAEARDARALAPDEV